MIVVGLDLSLTSTGWARIVTNPRLHGLSERVGGVEVGRINSNGRADASLTERRARIFGLADTISTEACRWGPTLVVVEAPSLGQKPQRGDFDRHGLWWATVSDITPRYAPVVEVSPSCLKKYATGKGNAGKDAVLAAVVRRYPDVEITGNDEADALILAAMGARHLGEPIETSLPAVNLAAMDKIAWPAP